MENTINTTDAAASAETTTQETNTENRQQKHRHLLQTQRPMDEAYVAGLQQKYNAERDAAVKAAVEEAVKKERMSAEERQSMKQNRGKLRYYQKGTGDQPA